MKRYKGKYKAQIIINIDASYEDGSKMYPVAEAKGRLLKNLTPGLQMFMQAHMGSKGTVEVIDPTVELYEVME